jgi:hypothetical protein
MLVAIYWQDRRDFRRVKLVAKKRFGYADRAMRWIEKVIRRRATEMPDGWCPLVSTTHPPS